MATTKTKTVTADAAQAAPASPQHAMPTKGGCWVRNADGTLSPDPTQAAAAPDNTPPAETPVKQE